MAAFVVVLLLSQVVGASKVAVVDVPGIGPWPFGAGILFFPISYLLGDVLTEVYGYARARRCIWAGFGGTLFLALMSWVVVALPPAPGWQGQAAYDQVFGQVPRIVGASICAFWAGEFANSLVLSRMKLWTNGRLLWTRTIGSTINCRSGRQRYFLSAGVLECAGLDASFGHQGHADELCVESRLGNSADAVHLLGGEHVEAARGDRRVRPNGGLHAVSCWCLTAIRSGEQVGCTEPVPPPTLVIMRTLWSAPLD